MKQINFSNPGGFPLEQETLERLQAAYRSELYDALKRHLSINPGQNCIIAHATDQAKGWAVIHQQDPVKPENTVGILYPIAIGTQMSYLKSICTETSLVYGTGESQTAYYDYEAEYSSNKYDDTIIVSENGEVQTIRYYDLGNFETITDIKTIDEILKSIQSNIDAIEGDVNNIKSDINLINQSYLPINGSKAMEGDLNLGLYHLSKLDTKQNSQANVRARDFRFGSSDGRGRFYSGDYLGRALVDDNTSASTTLNLNYESDWQNTSIGGKLYLDNLKAITENYKAPDSTENSLLVLDTANQVIKSNNLLSSLLDRITKLEDQKSTAVPIGMVAIWGKPAPFPEGWEEYVPLSGKMPVGLFNPSPEIRTVQIGQKNYYQNLTFYYNENGDLIWPFETLGDEGGHVAKNLNVDEMPKHSHGLGLGTGGANADGGSDFVKNSTTGTTFTTKEAGIGKAFPLMSPYRVVQFIEYTGRPSDKTPPTPPTLSVSTIGSTEVTLNWTASSDEYGVTDYIVYGNANSPISVGNVFTRTIYGLNPGTQYTFYVVAKDDAGNTSAQSNTVSITTSVIVAPTIPQNVTCYLQDRNEIMVQWDSSTNNGGSTIYYEIWRRVNNGTFNKLPTSVTNNYYSDTGLLYNTTYTYYIIAKDAANNRSDMSDYASETTETTSCFDVESLVTMASGQSKKLKNVIVGDKLQGLTFPNEIDESEGDYMLWNGLLSEASRAEVTVVNKITSIQPDYYEIKTEDATIKATGQHPLLVTEDGENLKWVCIKDIVQSMLLIDKTGKTKVIESIIFKEEPLEVALLDVETVDNYVISGIVAHNNKPLDPPTNP